MREVSRSGSIEYTTISNDGVDWMGHARGTPSSHTEVRKCRCPLGQAVGTHQVKKMCCNCSYYEGLECTNKKKEEEIKKAVSNLKVEIAYLRIVDEKAGCDLHELDYTIFKSLLKGELK